MVEEIVMPASEQGGELSNLPTVAVSGELDLAVAPWLHDQLEALFVGGADSIAVDLTGATFLDSTALGVLVGALNQCQARGGRLHLIAAPAADSAGVEDHRTVRRIHGAREPRRDGRSGGTVSAMTTQESRTSARELIEIVFPSSVELIVLARFTAATVGARANFDLNEIDDLRLAVDELSVSFGPLDGDTCLRYEFRARRRHGECSLHPRADGG